MKTDFLQPVLVEKKQFLCLRKWCDHVLKYNMPNTWMNILKTNSWVIWEVDKCTVTATAKNRYNGKNQSALDNLLRASRKRKKKTRRNQFAKYDCFWNVCLATDQQMLQLGLYFIFSWQYHIAFQHKPALTLKSTLVTSAALLWCSGILRLPPHTLPKPWLIAVPVGCGIAKHICFRLPTLQRPVPPSCSHLAQRKNTAWCANFLLSLPRLSHQCCPPLHTQCHLTSLSQSAVWACWLRSKS